MARNPEAREGSQSPQQEQKTKPNFIVGNPDGAFLARSLYLGEVEGTTEIRGGMFRTLYEENRASHEWTWQDFRKNTPEKTTDVFISLYAPTLGMMKGSAFRHSPLPTTQKKP